VLIIRRSTLYYTASGIIIVYVYHSSVEVSTSVHFSMKDIPLQTAKKHIP